METIPTSCDGCTHHAQDTQPPYNMYCNRGGVPMPCGFGCMYYTENELVFKRYCIDCGHIMRHNDDDKSEPEIVTNDDSETLICSKCHSTHLGVCCAYCDKKGVYFVGNIYTCEEHKKNV